MWQLWSTVAAGGADPPANFQDSDSKSLQNWSDFCCQRVRRSRPEIDHAQGEFTGDLIYQLKVVE